MSTHGSEGGNPVDTPRPGTRPTEEEEEQVSPQRAAQRLYDEMALAYREQGEDDLALNRKLLPAAATTVTHDDSE